MGWFTNIKKTEEGSAEESRKAVWDSELSKATADARKAGSKRVVGAKKGEQTVTGAEGGERIPPGVAEAAAKLFNPDAWRAIVKAPFNLGRAITGRQCWELEKTQEDTLAVSTSASAEYFLQSDPKWVCLTICAFNWAVILTEKWAANGVERNKELAIEEKKTPKNPQEPTHLVKV